jgi:hypothetical protein
MAIDYVLLVTSLIFAILVIIASLYFVVYFQHPQDKWVAWFPKLVVVDKKLNSDIIFFTSGMESLFTSIRCSESTRLLLYQRAADR